MDQSHCGFLFQVSYQKIDMKLPLKINVVEVSNRRNIPPPPPPVVRPGSKSGKLLHTVHIKAPNGFCTCKDWSWAHRQTINTLLEEESSSSSESSLESVIDLQPQHPESKSKEVESVSNAKEGGKSLLSSCDSPCSDCSEETSNTLPVHLNTVIDPQHPESKSREIESVSNAKEGEKSLLSSSSSRSPCSDCSDETSNTLPAHLNIGIEPLESKSREIESVSNAKEGEKSLLSSSSFPCSDSDCSEETSNTLPAHLNIGFEVFDPLEAPPFPDPLIKPGNDNPAYRTKIFRVINVYDNGMISLRSHAQLTNYLNMDAALQKFYSENDAVFKSSSFVTEENIVKMGYYVAKLGMRFERCQFLEFIKPKDLEQRPTNFNLRIRLLDFGIPMAVPDSTLRPMHKGFKVLPAQGYTAQILDHKPKSTGKDNPSLREAYQDKVYTVNVIKVDNSYPECPHIFCNFIEELK